MNPGLFWQDYLLCDIETNEKGWKVQRKETDFLALREVLSKLYPGCIIPPLPKKLVPTSDAVHKCKRAMQRFLDEIMEHPILSAAKPVRDFLEAAEKDFERVKVGFETAAAPKTVSECVTATGTAIVSFDHSLSQYCTKLSDSTLFLKEKFKEYYFACHYSAIHQSL